MNILYLYFSYGSDFAQQTPFSGQFLCKSKLCTKIRFDSQFVNRLDEHADIVAQDLTENLVDHPRVRLAPSRYFQVLLLPCVHCPPPAYCSFYVYHIMGMLTYQSLYDIHTLNSHWEAVLARSKYPGFQVLAVRPYVASAFGSKDAEDLPKVQESVLEYATGAGSN